MESQCLQYPPQQPPSSLPTNTRSQWKCQGTWVLPSQTSVGCALSLKEDTALDQLQ